MRRYYVQYPAAVLLVACGATEPSPPAQPDFTLTTPAVWAGEEALVHSDAFRSATTQPGMSIEGTLLSVRRIDDSTFGFLVPDNLGGEFLPDLVMDDLSPDIGTLTVYGFEETVVHGRTIGHPVRQLAIPGAFMLGNATTGMVAIDLSTGAGQDGPGVPVATETSIGPTPDAAVWAVRRMSRSPEVGLWRFGATGPAVQVGEFPVDSSPSVLVFALVGEETALTYRGSLAYRYARTGTSSWQTVSMEIRSDGGPELYMSPRGDRIGVVSSGSSHLFEGWRGVPVYSNEAALAFYLPEYRSSMEVAFSPDGGEMAIAVSGQSPGSYGLVRVDATSGQSIRYDQAPIISGLTYDRSRPLLYAVYWDADREAHMVRVLSTVDGEVVAEVAAPAFCGGRCQWRVSPVASTTQDYLYVGIPGDPFKIARYRLPPAGATR